MSRPLLAVAALSSKTVFEKIQLGEAIAAGIADNPTVFATPSPAATVIKAMTKELHDANVEAETGSHEGKQRLLLAISAFDAAIGEYQTYVNLIAKGNGVVIEQSGLQVSRPAQKTGPMPAPGNLLVGGNEPRQLTVSVETVAGAKAYVWEYAVGDALPKEDDGWRLACGTPTGKAIISGLTSKTTVWVRCAAIGSKGQGPWTAAISRTVL